mmetsp:Transcript_4113/g.13511  ORF Transcript_4113/g.13511 Transcript_4113/m.13511 type:complete len:404 (-) Transcript_4113:562-1773(-)
MSRLDRSPEAQGTARLGAGENLQGRRRTRRRVPAATLRVLGAGRRRVGRRRRRKKQRQRGPLELLQGCCCFGGGGGCSSRGGGGGGDRGGGGRRGRGGRGPRPRERVFAAGVAAFKAGGRRVRVVSRALVAGSWGERRTVRAEHRRSAGAELSPALQGAAPVADFHVPGVYVSVVAAGRVLAVRRLHLVFHRLHGGRHGRPEAADLKVALGHVRQGRAGLRAAGRHLEVVGLGRTSARGYHLLVQEPREEEDQGGPRQGGRRGAAGRHGGGFFGFDYEDEAEEEEGKATAAANRSRRAVRLPLGARVGRGERGDADGGKHAPDEGRRPGPRRREASRHAGPGPRVGAVFRDGARPREFGRRPRRAPGPRRRRWLLLRGGGPLVAAGRRGGGGGVEDGVRLGPG